MGKTFHDLLAEFRNEIHGQLATTRALVGGARGMLEMKLKVDGTDPEYSAARWVHFAHLGTLDKLELMFRRDGEYETFELLSVARNIFENLVWLRFLNRDFRNGLVFYAKLLEDEIQSNRSYVQEINDEAALFDTADQLDHEGLISTIGSLVDEHVDSSSVENAQAEHTRQEATLDDLVRREFSLYGDAATFNGYGFQAHLLRVKVLPEIESRLKMAVQKQTKLADYLRDNCPPRIAAAAQRRWNWKDRANDAGMLKQYDFLYGLTSRLLHSTPLNIITQKALTEPERLLVMDYSVVAAGDLLQEINKFDYPGRISAIAI